jgi:signal transduction histidine kinase
MIRTLFIIATIFGLVVNLYSDGVVLLQFKKSTESGDWVSHSYKISRAIDSVRIAVLQSQLRPSDHTLIDLKLAELKDLVKDLPSQNEKVAKLYKLSAVQVSAVSDNPALPILSEMASGEEALLEARLKTDSEVSVVAENQALIANAVDLLLIFLFLGFFLHEYKTNAKIRKSLALTLIQVEDSNMKLNATLASIDTKFKTIVHDLKNPLGVIRGYAELLFDDSNDRGTVNQMATVIQRVSNDTLKLVGTVLETKSHANSSPEKFDLYETLVETCTFLEPIAAEKKQKISVDKIGTTFSLIAEKRKVQDAIYNLVGNALKFSPRESLIRVECVNSGTNIEVKIIDQGPGFSENDFENLFISGKKLSAKPTGNEVSTGFGLFSAKQTVTNLGGTIEINNNFESGACVKVTFPSSALS